MPPDNTAYAREDLKESLYYCSNSMKYLGLSFDKPPNSKIYIFRKFLLIFSVSSVVYHVFSEIMNLIEVAKKSPKLEDIVPLLHIFGYGSLCLAKACVLLTSQNVFKKIIEDLSSIWPMPPLSEEIQLLKNKSVTTLVIRHKYYYYLTLYSVWFYSATPIAAYAYEYMQGIDPVMGFVWTCWYPFNKYKPFAHTMVYLFEIFIGLVCVHVMVSTDLLFTGLASHIGLLLRILHSQLEALGAEEKTEEEHYKDIISCVKLHQKLISYCDSIEAAFTFVNFIQIFMSSVNICCCVFVIVLLEPIVKLANKGFLISILIQIGVSCWYADDIITSNENVAISAYKSNWYNMSPRCRRALQILIIRAQKPIAFTALKYTNISMVTFSSILTRSYSYFALLYTMYDTR